MASALPSSFSAGSDSPWDTPVATPFESPATTPGGSPLFKGFDGKTLPQMKDIEMILSDGEALFPLPSRLVRLSSADFPLIPLY
jgi:hypothetical protein